MAYSILQPDESQTFYFRYGPMGEEHYFTIQEIASKVRAQYGDVFDTIVLLPYVYEPFGYMVGWCTIWSGYDDSMYLYDGEHDIGVGYTNSIAVRPLYSNYIPLYGFNTDGTISYSFGSTAFSTYYGGAPDYYIWNYVGNDSYVQPFVMYTECGCDHLYINGEEYFKGNAIVKVNYYIPSGDYQYTKLTYKKDKEPASVNDGTIVDLDMTQTEAIVDHLEENSTYYFTIFTDINESTSVSFKVEPNPVPPE